MSNALLFLAGSLALGLLIFVHETGHFLFAKLFGVRVITYSFGFGHRLFGVRWRGTDYRFSSIPFGGYVRMWGADPFEVEEAEADAEGLRSVAIDASSRPAVRGEWALQDVSVWKRLVIYAAGPAANLVVPFFVFVVLFMAGQPQLAPVIGNVVAGSVAATAGVLPGDYVVEVAGQPVRTLDELEDRWAAVAGLGQPVSLLVERGDAQVALELPIPADGSSERAMGDLGLQVSVPGSVVGVIHSASPAARAGIATGDRIVSAGGVPVETWPALVEQLSTAGDRLVVAWVHEGERREVELFADTAWIPPSLSAVLDGPADRWGLQTSTLMVGSFSDKSAAKAAGMELGASMLAIGGDRVLSWSDVLRAVGGSMVSEGEEGRAEPVEITVLQGDRAFALRVVPEVTKDTDASGRYRWRAMIGVGNLGGWADLPEVRIRYPLGEAVVLAAQDTVGLVRFTLEQITLMVTGQADAKKIMGGPVEIMRQTVEAAKAGIMYYARLLCMISISVGIVNLLPVPVLDGGHLLFYGLEAIRGRPVSPMLRERAQIVGVMLLVVLMIFVLVNDLGRWLGGGGG